MPAKIKQFNFFALANNYNALVKANEHTDQCEPFCKTTGRSRSQVIALIAACYIERKTLRVIRKALGARTNYLNHKINALETTLNGRKWPQ